MNNINFYGTEKPELIIIRGIPGSGKTTLAKTKYPNHVLCEADQYFEQAYGSYTYDPEKAADAHNFCFGKVSAIIEHGANVVVANTFTRLCEFERYLSLPANIQVIKALGRFKNVHGVPEEVIEKMLEQFEDYPE